MFSIDRLLWFRNWLIKIRRPLYKKLYGIDIPETASVSFSARFRVTSNGPITIGSHTLVAFKTLVMGHDPVTGSEAPVHIGSGCFIGGGSIIMPGVKIGDSSIVGAASVVCSDVPANTIVAGNPAVVLRTEVYPGPKGRLPGADAAAIASKKRLKEQRSLTAT